MFRSVISVAALAASVSAGAGEIDGKALLCKDTRDSNASLTGFYFREGKVYRSWLRQGGDIGDVVVNVRGIAESYETAIDSIEWKEYEDSITVLDRKTLSINFMDYSANVFIQQEWTCELAESMDAYHQALEAERVKVEERTAERMKENKI